MIHFEYQYLRQHRVLVAVNDNCCEICRRTQMECEITAPWKNHTFIAARCLASRMPAEWHISRNGAVPPSEQPVPTDDQESYRYDH